jgi:hypothetical protein
MNDMIKPPGPGDDGFGGSHGSGRLIKGVRLSWNQEWLDSDGCAPPLELLIPAIREVLQRWQDGKPTVIDTLPLPDEIAPLFEMVTLPLSADNKVCCPFQRRGRAFLHDLRRPFPLSGGRDKGHDLGRRRPD